MFSNCITVNEVKRRYHQLCFVCHPDTGGSNEAMRELNRLYLAALEALNNTTIRGDDGKDHTYYYNQDIEQSIMDKINELLKIKMKDVRILLVGYWVWITGNTREYKDRLKDLHCIWHSKRQMWYWHGTTYRHKYSNASFAEIAVSYGYQEFKQSEDNALIKA
jgi:hypothetical protein